MINLLITHGVDLVVRSARARIARASWLISGPARTPVPSAAGAADPAGPRPREITTRTRMVARYGKDDMNCGGMGDPERLRVKLRDRDGAEQIGADHQPARPP